MILLVFLNTRWTRLAVVVLCLLPVQYLKGEQQDPDLEDFRRLSGEALMSHRPWVASALKLTDEQRAGVSACLQRYRFALRVFIESGKLQSNEFSSAARESRRDVIRLLTREQRDVLAQLQHRDFAPSYPKANLVRFLPAAHVGDYKFANFPTELIEPLWKAEGTREEYAALILKCREDLLTWATEDREKAFDVMAGRLDPKDTPPGPRYLLMCHATPAVIKRFQNRQVPEGLRVEVEGSLIWLKKGDQTVGGPFWHDEEQIVVSQQFSPSGRLILTASQTQSRTGKVHRWWDIATGHLLWEGSTWSHIDVAILDDETLLLPTPLGAEILPSWRRDDGFWLIHNGQRMTMDSFGSMRLAFVPRNGDAGPTWRFTQTTAGMLIRSPAGYLAFDETGQKKAVTIVDIAGINTMWMYHSSSETFRPCASSLKGFMIEVRGGSLFLSKTPSHFQIKKAPPN